MGKLILKENEFISLIEKMINEAGDLYKKHKFGSGGNYCVIFYNKRDIQKSRENYLKTLKKVKPQFYYLSQYYDGTCCFITSMSKGEKVKPVLFDTMESADEELNFIMNNSPEVKKDFVGEILKYSDIIWK
jgi:hypothetical protein